MFLTPEQIAQRPDIVESTERATLRMVAHAIFLLGLTQLPIAFLLELEAVACESPYSTA